MIAKENRYAKIKIARIAAVSMSFVHVQGFLKKITEDDRFEVNLIASKDHFWNQLDQRFPHLRKLNLLINRDIALIQDLKSTYLLYKIFKKERYQLVHSHTPKAGLITSLAAFLAGVPVRIHTFTGQRWATFSGAKRELLKMLDRIIVLLNTHNLTDSFSQKDFLVKEFITPGKKISVIHKGNFAGIDLEKYNPYSEFINQQSLALASQLNLKQDHFTILFLGRVTKDKGIVELVEAFKMLQKNNFKVQLLLVGPQEAELDPLPAEIIREIENNQDIKSIAFHNQPELFYYLCDIFCLPSYREGFPNVVLEANAMKKAVVGTNVYGVTDSIVDGQSGLLCEARSSTDLYMKIKLLLEDQDLRIKLGEYGRKRVEEDFNHEVITAATIEMYCKLLKKKEVIK